MMNISLLKILDNLETITVSINTDVGHVITTVKLWTRDTFKDYAKAVNLSSKLNQNTNEETFQITSSDIGINKFNDIYFIEFIDDTGEILMGVTANFKKYSSCLLNKVLNLNLDNLSGCNNNIENVFILLENLKLALRSGYFIESITILNTLDKLCVSENCNNCDYLSFPIYYTEDNTFIIQ